MDGTMHFLVLCLDAFDVYLHASIPREVKNHLRKWNSLGSLNCQGIDFT